MAILRSYEDVAHTRKSKIREDGKQTSRTDFFAPTPDDPIHPQAFLSESGPQRHLRTHFHDVDEFQIFVAGGGTNGSHVIRPFQLHFARKHTPYGPIHAGDRGCQFVTLRRERDPGPQYLPEKRETLASHKKRAPWQVSADIDFPSVVDGVICQRVNGVHDENGLDAQVIAMPPGSSVRGPDASQGDGQYIVVLGGSLIHAGREYGATTIVWIEADEGYFPIEAGPKGLQAVSLNFPRRYALDDVSLKSAGQGKLKVWQCVLCGFVYDEAAGMPEDGIPAGTRWEDVPATFGCPDCSASKADFDMMER